MVEEIRMSQTFGSVDAGRYVRIYFDVPEGISRIDVSYVYPRRLSERRAEGLASIEANVVDIGLLDGEGRSRGWSGSERTSITVSVDSATPGYRAGPLGKGRWAVCLGLYRIRDRVDIDLVVRLHRKQRVLLAGDLHLHTLHSDGAYTTAEVIEFCRKVKLDFAALTDHNNTEQNVEVGRADDLVVISGMEYTNYRGHASFLFPDERVRFDEDCFSNSFEEMLEVFRRAKDRGALVSLNHPVGGECPWTFGFEGLPWDLVEVWNGPMKPADLLAIAWWHDRLAEGRRIPAVGGSDMHRHEMLRGYGLPTTFVYADSRSRPDILAALLAGRSFISWARSGPVLDLRIGDARLGETAASADLEGEVTVSGARTGDIVRVLDAGSGVAEWRIPFNGEFSARFTTKQAGRFYRAEVHRELMAGLPVLCCLSNPVFVA
jgi:hypothetical protein